MSMTRGKLLWASAVLLIAIVLPLSTVSLPIASLLRDYKNGVVTLASERSVKSRGIDLYDYYFGGELITAPGEHSLGSGVLIDKHYVLTTLAQVEGIVRLKIKIVGHKVPVSARVVGSDSELGLALVRLNTKLRRSLQALELGNSNSLRIGDALLLIGNPFGSGVVVSRGIVTARRFLPSQHRYNSRYQTDAPIYPGVIGGAVLDRRGRLVGMVTEQLRADAKHHFFMPANRIKGFVAQVKKYGRVKKVWLGVVLSPLDPVLSERRGKQSPGLYVANLIVDSPAYRAGFKIGDVIQQIDSEPISNLSKLVEVLAGKRLGTEAKFHIYRQGVGPKLFKLAIQAAPAAKDLPVIANLF